jgi:hypothetical protein
MNVYVQPPNHQLNIGDLIKVKGCPGPNYYDLDPPCECFFCSSGSNRIGFVIGPAPRNGWAVQFDTGQWRLYPMDLEDGGVEVIGESR